jgi:signal peptide peptidase SppA
MATIPVSPSSDNRVREVADLTLVPDAGDARPILAGSFGPFEEWVEINSVIEGNFMERFAPGCYEKTIHERRKTMRCLLRHGLDPLVGKNPIGKIRQLFEDGSAARYEVELYELPPLIMAGLRDGQYGSSHLFRPVKQEFVARPRKSEHNPKGLPECTVTEAYVHEFGPCPFPVYQSTTASIRSATDDWVRERFAGEEPARGHSTAFIPEAESTATRPADLSAESLSEREQHDQRLYARSLERIRALAWEIHPDALATIIGIVSERASGARLTDEEIRARLGLREEDVVVDMGDEPAEPDAPKSPVAVLSLHGPIVPRASFFTKTSGLASVEEFQASFRAALADDAVRAILIDIDSPGGDASLIPELSAEILAARGQKPIVAMANTWAASAAYHIAVSADEIVVTPSGEVGSIGVWTAHDDISAKQEKDGVKTTLVSAGKYKVERNPFEPLDDAAKSYMQEQVDETYATFLSDVAKGRGVPVGEVRSGYGEGRMVKAKKALDLGMVDRIATYDETLARLEKSAAKSREPQSTESEPSEATTPEKTTPEPSEATTRSPAQTAGILPRTGAESLTLEKERLP